jgi:rhamnosyl/mannosyltransferase
MRVLHVYKGYPPVVGGIENHLQALAEAQAAAGHEVTVLVTDPSRHTTAATVGAVRVVRAARLATVASTPLSLALVAALARLRPDVTHLHVPYPVGEAAWLLVGRRPMVLTYHSDVVRQRLLGRVWAHGLRRVLARADRVLATSPSYVESSPFLRRVRERVVVVPLGIDAGRFSPRAAAAGEPEAAPPVLVFVGRLRYYKGLDVLIDALVELPGVCLWVVGSGPMEQAWRARAQARGVAARVRWWGNVPDERLPGLLAAADAFVLPATARSEAFGIALIEAMAAGLPAVTTELGTGTSWVNQDGVTGIVVPARDAPVLAAGIARLLGDRRGRAAMGRAARARVLAHFTREQMVARVEQVYREVVAG